MGGSALRRRKSRRGASISSTTYSKKLKKKLKRTPLSLPAVRRYWKTGRTLKQNMDSLGISYDSNKVVPINGTFCEKVTSCESMSCLAVVDKDVASSEKRRKMSLSRSEKKLFLELSEKYGENYKSMTKDKKNTTQLTESQLRKKCLLATNL